MKRLGVLTLELAMVAALAGCHGHLYRRDGASDAVRPEQVVDFSQLYSQNCAACHGERGQGGASIALASPVYLAIAGDDVLRKATAEGVAGTPMPAFAKSSGGSLTEEQVSVLVRGMRAWARPQALAGATPPRYAGETAGDATRGAKAFATYCSSCHGANGRGGSKAGSVVDPSYLALVSDQNLRTIVIMGRPALDAPDWRNDLAGHPMSEEEVGDVVAWLAAHRVRFPGQPYPSGGDAGETTSAQGGRP
jgi:cytochrome c oxidase cbb3-type subunit 3